MRKKCCSICKIDLSIKKFNKKKSRLDGLQTHCKDCNRKHARAYYKENRLHHLNVILNRNKSLRDENHKKIFQFLLTHPCVDCGENNPLVLDFDHLHSKEAGVAELLNHCGWSRIQREIDKCAIRCRNCHSKKTHREQNSYRWKMVQKMFNARIN